MEKSNLPAKQEKRRLPTVEELYEDNLQVSFKSDQLNLLLNTAPKKEWIKTNKYANNSLYIPIGLVETNLQKLFKQIRWEVIREGVMFNAIYVCVRLHYFNPATNDWSFMDGLGGQQLQTAKGTSPAQLENINNNAVAIALPIAYAYAQKNAAKKLGDLFGRSLNRDEDVLEYTTSISIDTINDKKEKERLIEHIMGCKFSTDLRKSIGADILEKYDLTQVYELQLSKLEENELTQK